MTGYPKFTLIPGAVGVDDTTTTFAVTRFGLLRGVGPVDSDSNHSGASAQRPRDERLLTSKGAPQAALLQGSKRHHSSSLAKKIEEPQRFQVNVVDFGTWFRNSFRADDYIVVKMDIEGMEFPVLRELEEFGVLCHINVFAWQCHESPGGHTKPQCPGLEQRVKAACPDLMMLTESDFKGHNIGTLPSTYQGFDRDSMDEEARRVGEEGFK